MRPSSISGGSGGGVTAQAAGMVEVCVVGGVSSGCDAAPAAGVELVEMRARRHEKQVPQLALVGLGGLPFVLLDPPGRLQRSLRNLRLRMVLDLKYALAGDRHIEIDADREVLRVFVVL